MFSGISEKQEISLVVTFISQAIEHLQIFFRTLTQNILLRIFLLRLLKKSILSPIMKIYTI